MKKTIAYAFFIFFYLSAKSQDITFYAAGKSQLFASTIMNRSIIDDDNQSYSFAISGSGGVGCAFYLYDKIGLSFDILYGNHKSKYKAKEFSTEGDELNFQSEISYRSIHIPILLSILNHSDQKNNLGSGYFEIGPQFNNCMSPIYVRGNSSSQDISEFCRNTYWSGILGFGMLNSLGRRTRFDYRLGVRLEYGFSDLGSVNAFGLPFDSISTSKSLVLGIGLQFGIIYQLPIATNNSYLRFLRN